jgi:hypothetical protein
MAIYKLTEKVLVDDAENSLINNGNIDYGNKTQAEIDALTTVTKGSKVFNTTTDNLQVYITSWVNVSGLSRVLLDETSTIADFQTGKTHYYIGEAPITYDYDVIPYPLPTPVSNFNFVNLSVFDVLFTSDGGNYSYTLKPDQALRDIAIFDMGSTWELYVLEYIDNTYDLQNTTNKGSVTTNAITVRNNPDTYRTRYSTVGMQIQRSDLGNQIVYDDLGVILTKNTGNKAFAVNLPDITANANNSSFTVDFRPNVSGTVAYLSDIITGAITEQTHTAGGSVIIDDSTTILYIDPVSTLATLTITMPANPINGQEVKVSFGGAITSGLVVTVLTIVGNTGQSVLAGSSITTAQVGVGYIFKYQASSNIWRIF